jgi:UDP-glucose 4-epimerase
MDLTDMQALKSCNKGKSYKIRENMRILFTGATSFTGTLFVEKLAEAGHHVVAIIRSSRENYYGLRAERLQRLTGHCALEWGVPFGTDAFLDLISRRGPFDILCHHAAEVTDYKSPDFDVAAAVSANTHQLLAVLEKLRNTNCRRIVLTGSVFEADEGTGSQPLRAFSPYGVSKTLTAQRFLQETENCGLALGKFVIPNPFGPYEEPRFTHYLMTRWKEGLSAKINTPNYVRDNIPASLLAAVYARFVSDLPPSGFHRINPSFYTEPQGAFAERFAREMRQRLALPAALEFADQIDFPEPVIRINTDPVRSVDFGWSEQAFWDETAQYYAHRLDIPVR